MVAAGMGQPWRGPSQHQTAPRQPGSAAGFAAWGISEKTVEPAGEKGAEVAGEAAVEHASEKGAGAAS